MAAIALFKLLKGGLLLALGLGLLKLVHVEVATVFSLLIEALHLDADSRFIHGMVLRVDALQPHSLQVAALVSLAYAALLTVEGSGCGWSSAGPPTSRCSRRVCWYRLSCMNSSNGLLLCA
ncbi:MAG: DUF2127 domain-containing protein [Nitrospiraceae bacterium]